MLLEAGSDVNATTTADCHTYPPDALSCAARIGAIETIQLLLKAGARINPEDKEEGTNALYYAARNDNIEAVELLLKAGSWVDVCNKHNGKTTLVACAMYASIDVWRLLIEHGADVNKSGKNGVTPLAAAVGSYCNKNRAEMIKMLMAAGANFDSYRRFAARSLEFAVVHGDINALRIHELTGLYLQPEFSSEWGPEALCIASAKGRAEAVQFLVERGADVNVKGRSRFTALMQAGSQEVIDILLDAGATIPANELERSWAFNNAIRGDNLLLIRVLLGAGFNINSPELDPPPLSTAVGVGAQKVLPLLLDAGANLDWRDRRGRTALVDAAIGDKAHAVGHLVHAGANVNVTTRNSLDPAQVCRIQRQQKNGPHVGRCWC